MDNVGDWIYIVFLIVAAISSLFGSKKKAPETDLGAARTRKCHNPKENTSSGKGFWEILEKGKIQNRKQQLPDPNKKKKNTCLKTIFYHQQPKNQKSKAIHPNPMNFPIEEEHSMLEDIEFNNAEELRKAVIYSEILNRKY